MIIRQREFSFLISLGLVLTSVVSLFSQSFGTPDSEWTYVWEERRGITQVKYTSDTLINNLELAEYSIVTTGLSPDLTDTVVTVRDPVYISNTDGLALFTLDGESFDTLINFNADIGDRWSIVRAPGLDSFEFIVIDTFITEFSGQDLFSMAYEFVWRTSSTNRTIVDTIYETIGTVNNFLIAYDGYGELGFGNIGGRLRCYSDPEIGTINFGLPWWWSGTEFVFEFECNNSVSTRDKFLEQESNILAKPNPFQFQICIQTKDLKEDITIYNLEGQLLEMYQARTEETCLDLSHLEMGMYLLKIGTRLKRIVKI